LVGRGAGKSATPWGTVEWSKGDVFVLPGSDKSITHTVKEAFPETADGSAALYWVTDEPLLKYLGVAPSEKRFEPAFFCHEVGHW
jgi:gentisate 1,2-dioxygenase